MYQLGCVVLQGSCCSHRRVKKCWAKVFTTAEDCHFTPLCSAGLTGGLRADMKPERRCRVARCVKRARIELCQSTCEPVSATAPWQNWVVFSWTLTCSAKMTSRVHLRECGDGFCVIWWTYSLGLLKGELTGNCCRVPSCGRNSAAWKRPERPEGGSC